MNRPIPDPDRAATDDDPSGTDPVARIADYLDFFRGEVRRKTSGLDDAALQRVIVPSGWTMPGLVEHLQERLGVTVVHADVSLRLHDTARTRSDEFDSFAPSAAVSIGLILGAAA